MADNRFMRPTNWQSFLKLLLTVLVLQAGPLHGRAWTSRAGARALGLGESVGVALDGLEGLAYNPAAAPEQASFLLSHTFWAQDLNAEHALAGFGWGPLRLGLQASVESALGVERRDANGLLLGTAAWSRQEAALSAAASLGPLDLGAQIGGESFSAYAPGGAMQGSLGLAWTPKPGLRVGAAADRQDELWQWRLAATGPLPYAPAWTLGAGVLADSLDTRWGLGLEWQAFDDLGLRAGWQRLQGPATDSPGSWSLGMGAHLSGGQLDYAYQDLGVLGGSHRLQWRSELALRGTPTPQPTATAVVTATFTPTPPLSPTPTLTPILTPILTPTPTPTPSNPKRPVPLRFVIPE